jgi:hypothetical protein
VGTPRGVCPGPRSAVHPRAGGGRGDGVMRAQEVSPTGSRRCAVRIPEWVWQAAEAGHDLRHPHGAPAAGARAGGAICEPHPAAVRAPDEAGGRLVTAAVPAWAGARRLRTGAAGPLGRRGAVVAGVAAGG